MAIGIVNGGWRVVLGPNLAPSRWAAFPTHSPRDPVARACGLVGGRNSRFVCRRATAHAPGAGAAPKSRIKRSDAAVPNCPTCRRLRRPRQRQKTTDRSRTASASQAERSRGIFFRYAPVRAHKKGNHNDTKNTKRKQFSQRLISSFVTFVAWWFSIAFSGLAPRFVHPSAGPLATNHGPCCRPQLAPASNGAVSTTVLVGNVVVYVPS
jgi:hypothetical protein